MNAFPPLSAEARAAWIHMRDEGGWWSSREIEIELYPRRGEKWSGTTGVRWLAALARRGHVQRNPRDVHIFTYGVTARCIPIDGESLDPQPLSSTSLPEELQA